MKKLAVIICIAVLLLLPTVLAVILYEKPEENPVEHPETIAKATITDNQSHVYEITDAEEMKLLAELANGTSVGSIPDDVRAFTQIFISFVNGESTQTYRFYMSADMPGETYYENSEGALFKADALKARSFMEKEYAISLYNTAVPTLTVGNTQTVVTPSSMTWSYNHIGDGFYPVEVPVASEVPDIDDISKTLGISFSIKPTSVIITVYEDGVAQVSRLLSDFVGITTQTTKYFRIKLEASWSATDGANAYGDAVYMFNAHIRADARFAIGVAEVYQGGVFELAAKNASLSTLKFKCEPDIGTTPVFYADGDILRAYLPTSYATAPGEYVITLSNEDITSEYKINVKDSTYSSKTYTTALSALNEILSTENREALQGIITSVFASESSQTPLWGNETLICPTYKQVHKTGYGITMRLDATGEEFSHLGMDYDVASGTDVQAVLSGKIVYVGENPIYGGIVVIDHGQGLRSWYCRVDESSVSVGQVVAQGDVIAKSDNSGFGDARRMHFAMSAGSTFISPLWVLENGFSAAIAE